MEIFDDKNTYLSQIFLLSSDNIPVDFVKDVVFVDTKQYKYYPPFTHVYSISQDKKIARILSIFDIFEKEGKESMSFASHVNLLYKNISNDFSNLSIELFYDAIDIFLNEKDRGEKIQAILLTIPEFSKKVNDFINIMENYKEDINSPTSSAAWSQVSQENPDPLPNFPTGDKIELKSSVSETSSDYRNKNINDLLEELNVIETVPVSEKEKETGYDSRGFSVNINSYDFYLTKNKDTDIDLIKLYNLFEMDENYIAYGMVIHGESKYKKIKTEDKKVQRLIEEFTKSEHIKNSFKFLKPFIFYFIYYSKRGVIHGELRTRGSINLKFKADVPLKDFEDHVNYSKDLAKKISSKFEKYIKLIPNENIQPTYINMKIIYESGHLPVDLVKKVFNARQDTGRQILRFNLATKDGNTIKEIMYSTKDERSNFTVQKLLSRRYINEIIAGISYIFKQFKNQIILKIEKETKKSEIKKLKSEGIETNARSCQKERRPELINEDAIIPEGVNAINYKNKKLMCNKNYPWPGFTKSGSIPCCFKKSQASKEAYTAILGRPLSQIETEMVENESLQNISVLSKILSKKPLSKDNVKMEKYQRGKFSNKILSSIFGDSEYYSLSMGIKDNTLLDCLKFAYGSDIILEILQNTSRDTYEKYNISEEDYDSWKTGDGSIESIIKAFCHYKKINPLVIQETSGGTKIVCSITHFFLYKIYIVFIGNKEGNYKILVNTPENKTVIHEIDYDDEYIQKLISLYNNYCSILPKCKFHILNVEELKDSIEITNQIVNAYNKVYYVETVDYGFLPVNPSNIDYSIPSKSFKDTVFLNQQEQYDKLLKISKKYKYFLPRKITVSVQNGYINGIEISCDLIVPVEEEEVSLDLEKSEQNFYVDLDEKIKDSIISDEALEFFSANLENSYTRIATKLIIKYLNQPENKKEKNSYLNLISSEDYDSLINKLISLLVKEEIEINKTNLPLEETIPFKINSRVYLNVLSKIVWKMINDQALFFDNTVMEDNVINVDFIPGIEEIEIS